MDLVVKLNLLFSVQPLWLLTGKFEPTAGEQLTADERELLLGYRNTDAKGREMALAFITRLGKSDTVRI